MNKIELNTKANGLFQELNKQKIKLEEQGKYEKSFRVECIDKIKTFFEHVSDHYDGIELHLVSEANKGIIIFDKALSPIDLELVCTSIRVHIPNWFKLICVKFLELDFSRSKIESSLYDDDWMLKEVQELKRKMTDYQSKSEDLYQVLERFIFTSQKMNLFGNETKNEFANIELKGLLIALLDDFEIFGWDIRSNLGMEDFKPKDIYLHVFFDKDVYVNIIESLSPLLEKHSLSKAYDIIRNSIHKTNQEYLEAIIKGKQPKVYWNVDSLV